MIKWKSLIYFIITILIILGAIGGLGWYGYNKVLDKLAEKHPEIRVTIDSSATYSPDYNAIKNFEEFKDGGYSIMLPKGYQVIKDKDDPDIDIVGAKDQWEIRIQPKLIRYDETIQGNSFINNPSGDYYILLREVFKSVKNPILIFQKISYLPSSTTHIKAIKTPYFFGFYIVGNEGGHRVEMYRLFDEEYWHNVIVTIYDSNFPQKRIQDMIASLRNDESSARASVSKEPELAPEQ